MQPSGIKSDPQLLQRRVLRAVALFEFAKGIFVVSMGTCAILLLHKDVWVLAEIILGLLHIDTDRRFAQLFLDFADSLTDARLWSAAEVAFLYAALRFTESYGLWKERTWAEWVALISGCLLLPFEIRELLRGVTVLRSVFFLGNVAVVFYILHVIRSNRRNRKNAAELRHVGETPRQEPELESNDSGR
jgi:uncharacterized membrane protein (DUF2068 family)